MRYLTLIMVCATLCSCVKNLSTDELFELCPYEHRYGSGAHYMVVPITMIPHQINYEIGDTLTVQMDFPDSLYDLAKDVTFLVEDFPFMPATALYRVRSDGWDSGYRLNEVLVEDKYSPTFNSQIDFADDMRGVSLYQDGRYNFEYKIVFETAGNYCTFIADQYVLNLGRFGDELNAEADAIEFEGKCSEAGFFNISIVEGDPHYDEYSEELVYLDQEVFRDNLARPDGVDKDLYGNGAIAIDWRGMFCFTVEE